jgi:hypothetical protein
VSEEFHELLLRYAREQLTDHMLGSFAIKGKKEQSLFEFPDGFDYAPELFDVVAQVCGLDHVGMTLSERHIQCYEADADPSRRLTRTGSPRRCRWGCRSIFPRSRRSCSTHTSTVA